MASIMATLIQRVPIILYPHGRPSPEGLRRPSGGGPDHVSEVPSEGYIQRGDQDPDLDLRFIISIGDLQKQAKRTPNNGHLGPHLGPFLTSMRWDGTIWRPHIPVYRGRALRAPSRGVSACSKWWSGALRPCSKWHVIMGIPPSRRPIPRDITRDELPSEGSDEAILT